MEEESRIMRRGWLPSIGAVVLAFLAGQHHSLHMLLLPLGLGGAGTSFMTAVPLVRRVATLGLAAWSIQQSGW